MTDNIPDAPAQVPATSSAEKFMRFAKTHVAVLGAVLIFVEQNLSLSPDVKHWVALALGLGAALGVWAVPNAPSESDKLMQAHAMSVQAANPPEDPSIDVTAPKPPSSDSSATSTTSGVI